jgi:raffinose/stachyose/melibiose transport system substrate-binding protein
MRKALFSLVIFILAGTFLFAGGARQGSSVSRKKQLTVLQHIGEESGIRWLEYVVQSFMEKNADVSIEIQNMGFDSYVTTLQTKIASNDAPDIFVTEGDQMQTFYNNGYLLNLSGQGLEQSYNPQDLALVTINGELVALPIGFTSMCVMYNKDVFNSLGITRASQTVDEFNEVCKIIKARGIAPIAAGYKETWCLMADMQADYILSVLSRDPDAILDLLSREKTFADSPLWREVFTRLFERYQYVNSDPFGTDWNNAIDLLASGQAAMVLNGSWAVSAIRDKTKDGKIGLFPYPYSNNPGDSRLIVMSTNSGTAIFKNTPNKEAALALVRYMFSPEMGTAYARMTNNVTIIRGSEAPGEEAWQDANAYINRGQTFSNGSIDHNFPNEYRVAVETVVSKHLLAGTRDISVLLRELDTEFDRIARSVN